MDKWMEVSLSLSPSLSLSLYIYIYVAATDVTHWSIETSLVKRKKGAGVRMIWIAPWNYSICVPQWEPNGHMSSRSGFILIQSHLVWLKRTTEHRWDLFRKRVNNGYQNFWLHLEHEFVVYLPEYFSLLYWILFPKSVAWLTSFCFLFYFI